MSIQLPSSPRPMRFVEVHSIFNISTNIQLLSFFNINTKHPTTSNLPYLDKYSTTFNPSYKYKHEKTLNSQHKHKQSNTRNHESHSKQAIYGSTNKKREGKGVERGDLTRNRCRFKYLQENCLGKNTSKYPLTPNSRSPPTPPTPQTPPTPRTPPTSRTPPTPSSPKTMTLSQGLKNNWEDASDEDMIAALPVHVTHHIQQQIRETVYEEIFINSVQNHESMPRYTKKIWMRQRRGQLEEESQRQWEKMSMDEILDWAERLELLEVMRECAWKEFCGGK